METPDAYKLLLDYPIKHGLDYETQDSVSKFHMVPIGPRLSTKYILFRKGEVYFYAYDSSSNRAQMSKTTTGLYTESLASLQPEFKAYKKNKFDILFRTNKRKSGMNFFDTELTLCSRAKDVKTFMSKEEVMMFLKLHKQIQPLSIFLQSDYLPSVKMLKGKQIIGLETNYWIYDHNIIDSMMNTGVELLENMRKNSYGYR